VDGTGYLSVTDAVNNAIGAILIGDLDNGLAVKGFNITADLRVGGGNNPSGNPADGFSFNFADFDDQVIIGDLEQFPNGDDPQAIVNGGFGGVGAGGYWAPSPNGAEEALPEEGTRTGIAIGFDEWESGAPDVVGLSLRVDNELIDQAELPVRNEGDDEMSLQTGPHDVPASELGWAQLVMNLDPDTNELLVLWKDEIAFQTVVPWTPRAGALVFGGRTGGANSNHHIDNIRITTFTDIDPVLPWPGDVDGDRHTDVTDLNIIGINWNTSGKTREEGDLTGDTNVNAADLNALALAWQTWDPDVAMPAAVPEPSSIALMLAGLLAACGFVRKRS
jgi:hypothetical protein